MTTKVQKLGNSLGIHIPKKFTEALSFKKGSPVSIRKIGKSLIIELKEEEETLESLLAQITPENRHEEIDWGGPVGREIW